MHQIVTVICVPIIIKGFSKLKLTSFNIGTNDSFIIMLIFMMILYLLISMTEPAHEVTLFGPAKETNCSHSLADAYI